MNYKFLTDSTVSRVDDDGISRLSCSVDNEDYQLWLSEGNTPIPADQVDNAPIVRAQRNALLSASDWTVLDDAQLTASQKTVWKNYRQALRDITAQAGFPGVVEWPVQP